MWPVVKFIWELKVFYRFTLMIVFCWLQLVMSSPLRAADKPNILFLLADDLCFEALGCMGNAEVATPNLDRLAARGLTFTHAYNMGSWHGAVCMPSRGMLNTGRFLWSFQSVDNQMDSERQAGRMWAQYMARAGYQTYMAGKWHIKTDAERTFQQTGTIRGGMPKDTKEGYNRPLAGMADPWSPFDPEFGGFWDGGRHWSEVLADQACGFLQQASKSAEPFFMYVAFNAPHDPRQSPKEYVDRYPIENIKVPLNFLPEYPFKDDIGCPHKLRDEHLAPMPRTEQAIRVHRREYYAIITHLDAQIGRVLDALDATSMAQDTWIFFTADHGLAVGQHGLLGKQNLYDHSIRVPFIVVGPNVPQGKQTRAPIYYQDVMPTTLELAGVERPDHVDFQSLLPVIRDNSPSKYGSIYNAYIDLQRSVTVAGWKLLLYPKIKKVRLYHLVNDPLEMHDLADSVEQLERKQLLFAELVRWQKKTRDQLDLTATYPELQ